MKPEPKPQPLPGKLSDADRWQLSALTERIARIDRDKRLIIEEDRKAQEEYNACAERIRLEYQIGAADKVSIPDGVIARVPQPDAAPEPQALRPVG